ncbi:TetR family transcriptional regulator [Nocardioides humilatus]|uniref:TetR family transcriptional regulator n=1 Tax=Nocardioides humilatus TaxID=2607660 RepID=A0A5B1LHR2_9ACTN|nr:TetR family transcriptional regulator [Nocardioides humilatus]KAA1420193.1 TetR family transcriptional regulator [Nocardioides humilatus]
MTGSKWEQRRVETTQRLERCALELTRDKGFDGWTIDDVATAAEVSRRTVFNYFDSKADLVLGPVHEDNDTLVAVFVAGGPSGHLWNDLVETATLTVEDKGADDLELAVLRRKVICSDPRVIAIAHERFEVVLERSVGLILEREGSDFGERRARLLVQLLVTIFDSVVAGEPDGTRPMSDLINEAVADARAALTS